eukprot:UN04339
MSLQIILHQFYEIKQRNVLLLLCASICRRILCFLDLKLSFQITIYLYETSDRFALYTVDKSCFEVDSHNQCFFIPFLQIRYGAIVLTVFCKLDSRGGDSVTTRLSYFNNI